MAAINAYTTCCEGKPVLLRVPSPVSLAFLARLTVPAECTGILALPGVCDHLAAAREFAFAFVCVYMYYLFIMILSFSLLSNHASLNCC